MESTWGGVGHWVGGQLRGWASSLRLVAMVRHAGWVGPAAVGVTVFSALYVAGRAVVIGLVVGRVSSVASGAGSLGDLVGPLGLFAGVLALEQLTSSVVEPLTLTMSQRLEEHWRGRVRAALAARTDIALIEESSTQNDIAVATAGAAGVTVSGAIASVTAAIAVTTALVASGAVLLGLSAPLAVIYVGVLLGGRSVMRAKSRGIIAVQREQAPLMRRRSYLGTLHRVAAKETRVYGLAGFVLDSHDDVQREAYVPIFAAYWERYRLQLAFIAVAVGVLGVIGVVAVGEAVDGAISPGRATTYVLAAESMLMGLAATISPRAQASALFEALDRLTALPIVSASPARPASSASVGPELLRLDDVRFTYPGSQRPVLDGIDLVVQPGESVAVVGINGAGKTSLIKVIAGLYEPTSGCVYVRGEPLTPDRVDAWRAELGAVFQDFVHYPLSVRANVSLGRGEVEGDLQTVRRSLTAAGAGSLIETPGFGVETVLSKEFEGGTELSGGQWQRIALARSLYASARGAALLLLDEPTANLDVRAELETFERLRAHAGGAATIIVSHRFSTVRKADRIVVIDAGRVVQEGPHEELVTQDGLYRGMFLAQAARFGRTHAGGDT